MKFILPKSQLLELVSLIQNVIPTAQKASAPILANVLVEAFNDEIVLTATDLTMGIRCYTPAKVLSEGSTTLPARRFFQLVKELPDVNVEISTSKEHNTDIHAGASDFRLNGLSPSAFPSLPDLADAVCLKLEERLLKEILFRTAFAVSREDTRYVLTGLLLRIADGKATFLGTDGKRLAKIESTFAVDPELKGSYILPIRSVETILRALKERSNLDSLYLLPDKVAVEAERSILITKLLTGEYPQLDQVIPKKSDSLISLHREELISLLRQVSLFTTETSNSVRFIFTPGELTLTVNTMDIGEGTVNMPVNFTKEKLEIAFNPNFFLDILQHSRDESVNLGLTDSYNPGIITDSSNGLFVIMPLRLNE